MRIGLACGVLAAFLLSGCSDFSVSARTEHWQCTRTECVVTFTLHNESTRHEVVSYAVRAHRVEQIRGSEGAVRNIVVGELKGEAALPGLGRKSMKETVKVRGRPSQVVVTVWAKH
jgi:hypothetical protein